MFRSATRFNGEIGSWDVSNVSQMDAMFLDASSFVQSLSDWDVSHVAEEPDRFDRGSSAAWRDAMKPRWGR